jgi:ribonuclease HII
VVAAAVILPDGFTLEWLTDSKKVTPRRRELLEPQIKAGALAWSVASAAPQEIDEINILQATLLAMRRAVEGLSICPDYALIDGNQWPELAVPGECLVGGDAIEPAISAASILAKVARDRTMLALADQYPEYGFAKHKGYPTKDHMAALIEYGASPQHRRSFAPVRRVVEGS